MEKVKCFKCSNPAEYKIRSWWLEDWREYTFFACGEHAREWEEAFWRDMREGRISWAWEYRITPMNE